MATTTLSLNKHADLDELFKNAVEGSGFEFEHAEYPDELEYGNSFWTQCLKGSPPFCSEIGLFYKKSSGKKARITFGIKETDSGITLTITNHSDSNDVNKVMKKFKELAKKYQVTTGGSRRTRRAGRGKRTRRTRRR